MHRLVQRVGQITQESAEGDKARGLKALIENISCDMMPYRESIAYLNRIFRDGGRFNKDPNDIQIVKVSDASISHLQILKNHIRRITEMRLIDDVSLHELNRKLDTTMKSLLDIRSKGLKHYFATRNPFEIGVTEKEILEFHQFTQSELQLDDMTYQELWAQVESAFTGFKVDKDRSGNTYLVELLKLLVPLSPDKRALIFSLSMLLSEGLDITESFFIGKRIATTMEASISEETVRKMESGTDSLRRVLSRESATERLEILKIANTRSPEHFKRLLDTTVSVLKNHDIPHPIHIFEFFSCVQSEHFENVARDIQFFFFLADEEHVHDLVRTIYCLHLGNSTSVIERVKSDRTRGMSNENCYSSLQAGLSEMNDRKRM